MNIGRFDIRGSRLKLAWVDYTDRHGRARRKALGVVELEKETEEDLILKNAPELDELWGEPDRFWDKAEPDEKRGQLNLDL